MVLDVESTIEIRRPRAQVAAYACEPDNATAWRAQVTAVQWQSPRPLAVGTRLVLARGRLAYRYDVCELLPGERLVLQTAEGPFPIETTYAWEDLAHGATRMTLRHRGESSYSKPSTSLIARSLARADRRDLRRLKRILEGDGA